MPGRAHEGCYPVAMKHGHWSRDAALGAALLGAPACCVCASTLVRTPSGPRRLGELVLGDEVLSLDVESGELVATRIVGMRIAQRECMRIVHPGGELVCTPDHPIYSPESGEYEPASRWVDGVRRSVLLVGEGPAAAEVVATQAFVDVRDVVDITVDAPMHNFVAGGVLVHNKSFDTMVYDEVEGPDFILAIADRGQEFEIRACVDGRDPASYSFLDFDLSSRADPAASMDTMRFAVRVEQEGRVLQEIENEVADVHYLRLDTLADACLSPLSIAFERVDDQPDGTIAFTWSIHGGSEPPSGDFEDELVLEITEVPEG